MLGNIPDPTPAADQVTEIQILQAAVFGQNSIPRLSQGISCSIGIRKGDNLTRRASLVSTSRGSKRSR